MPVRSGILVPRAPSRLQRDLAARRALTGGQRVRRRSRTRLTAGRLLRWTGLALLVTAVVIGGRLGVNSSFFAIKEVRVVGASRTSEAELAAAAGIVSGTNIFSIDPGAIRERIEALPQVRHADVVRELPRRVTLVVEERQPFALALAGGLVWVDEEGAVLEDQPRPVSSPLPIISGLTAEELTPGRRIPSDRLRAAIALCRSLARSGGRLPSLISEVDISQPDAPRLFTRLGTEVRLGRAPWDDHLARLDALVGQFTREEEAPLAVDLRFQNLVVLTPKGGK